MELLQQALQVRRVVAPFLRDRVRRMEEAGWWEAEELADLEDMPDLQLDSSVQHATHDAAAHAQRFLDTPLFSAREMDGGSQQLGEADDLGFSFFCHGGEAYNKTTLLPSSRAQFA
jgi:hypothetical protein